MKKLILFLSFCISFSVVQAQQLLWHHPVGDLDSTAFEYVTLADGGYAAVFRKGGFNRVSITRYDSLGNQVWTTPLAPNLRMADFMHAMLKVVPGGLIAGMQQYNPDTNRLALVKVNWQGTVLWTKTIPTGRNHNTACDLHIRSANEYILLATGANNGQTLGNGGGFKHIAISIDSTGNINWRKTYLDPLQGIDVPRNVFPYSPKGFMLTGYTGLDNGFVRLIKTDTLGNVLQNLLFSDTAAPDGYSAHVNNFIPLSDGNIVFTGYHRSNNLLDRHILATKVDTAFNKLWTVTHAEPGGQLEYSNVHELENGNILLVTQQIGGNQLILLTISPQGQKLDTAYVTIPPTPYFGALSSSFLLPDGSLFYGGWDFMAKIGNVGLATTFTSSPDQINVSPLLGLAFPNPTENTVTVPYNIPEGTNSATFRIAEVATGRLVKEVPLNLQAEHVQLQLDRFASGLYTYTLLLDGTPHATKKLVVIK